MIINFSLGETTRSCNSFTQATIELSYQGELSTGHYVKRFSAQLPLTSGSEIQQFFEDNPDGSFQIDAFPGTENEITLEGCRLIFVIIDLVNEFIRVELRKD